MNPELSMLNGLSSIQHPTLEEIIRAGAQQMIAMAVEAEVKAYVEQFAHITTPEGKAAMVRNGYLPERSITTSAGPISVRVPRTRASVETLKPFISASRKPYRCSILAGYQTTTSFRLLKSCLASFPPAFHRRPLPE
jgi:putative transposase